MQYHRPATCSWGSCQLITTEQGATYQRVGGPIELQLSFWQSPSEVVERIPDGLLNLVVDTDIEDRSGLAPRWS